MKDLPQGVLPDIDAPPGVYRWPDGTKIFRHQDGKVVVSPPRKSDRSFSPKPDKVGAVTLVEKTG